MLHRETENFQTLFKYFSTLTDTCKKVKKYFCYLQTFEVFGFLFGLRVCLTQFILNFQLINLETIFNFYHVGLKMYYKLSYEITINIVSTIKK